MPTCMQRGREGGREIERQSLLINLTIHTIIFHCLKFPVTHRCMSGGCHRCNIVYNWNKMVLFILSFFSRHLSCRSVVWENFGIYWVMSLRTLYRVMLLFRLNVILISNMYSHNLKKKSHVFIFLLNKNKKFWEDLINPTFLLHRHSVL
jgi:hypothetical protein